MGKREFTFLSSDKKTHLHAVEWIPECEVRAVLQLSHGVSEHILRYEDFALFLNKKGIAVVGHDHLGHGGSVAPDGVPGYFGKKGSWANVIADIEERRRLAAESFPNVPYILMGHSMGSFLARGYLIKYPGTVDGAIIMGTSHPDRGILKAAGPLVGLIGKLKGETKPSAFIDGLAFGTYNKHFKPNRTKLDWLSINTDNIDRYLRDPLCGQTVTPGLVRELLSGLLLMTDAAEASKMADRPVLFISGAMDPVGGLSKEVRKAYDMFKAVGMSEVTLKLYPELRHEILNEDCREEVYEYIYSWLTEHFSL